MKSFLPILALVFPTLVAGQESTHYDWLTQQEISGSLVVTVDGSGARISRFEFNDRGRGPSLHETYQTDENGLISRFEVRGHAYMGGQVTERFDHQDDQARWESTLESGRMEGELSAFYLANDGTPEQLAALARALLAAPAKSLPVLPAGEASIEQLLETPVDNGESTRTVGLYAISGLAFNPSYLWLDENRELFAIAGGWMGLTPAGWNAVLPQLTELQEDAQRKAQQDLARQLTHRLPDAWCLSDFAVVDVDAGRVMPGTTVRVANGVIAAVGGNDAINCTGLPVIPGHGHTLMPGLWDMHVHIRLSDGLLHLAAGVTTVRDLANDHDRLVDAIEQFERGDAIGPRVYRAGFIDGRGPFAAPTGNLAADLDEALGFVTDIAEKGYPHIKIYSSIRPDWVAPLAEAIHTREMKLSGHIPSGMSAEQAVRSGFDEIQHINMVFLNFLAGPQDDTRTPLRFTLVAERGADLDLASEPVDAFIDLLRARGTVIDPTAAIFDSMFRHRPGTLDPSFAMIADHLPPNVRRSMLSGGLEIDEDNAERYAASADALIKMIGLLHAAGVPLVAGTDSLAGFTLHRELELYAEAGISNADVLRLATIGAAGVAGADDRIGRIAPGYSADLIALAGNPLDDIGNLRRVVLTVAGERLYRPEALYRAIGVKPFVAALGPPMALATETD